MVLHARGLGSRWLVVVLGRLVLVTISPFSLLSFDLLWDMWSGRRQSFVGAEGVGAEGVGVAEWSASSRCASLWASIGSGSIRGLWTWLCWLSPGGPSIWGFSSTFLFICFHGVSSPVLVVQHYLISFDSGSQKLLTKVFCLVVAEVLLLRIGCSIIRCWRQMFYVLSLL